MAMLRARPLYWRTTFAVQKSAIAVCSGVRVVLVAAPSDLTSLNAATHCGLDSDGGGAGWNWPARLSRNGRTLAIHGVCGAAYALGVSRQTPGPGGSVGNGEVEAIGVCSPSPARSRSSLSRRQRAVLDPVALRRPGRDRGERGVVERRQVGLPRREVVDEDVVGGLGDGGVRRLAVALAGAHGTRSSPSRRRPCRRSPRPGTRPSPRPCPRRSGPTAARRSPAATRRKRWWPRRPAPRPPSR